MLIDGDGIAFDKTSFSAEMCRVNGRETDLAAHLRDQKIDTKLPLVSNYSSAMINVAFQAVHDNRVDFFTPVVSGITYHMVVPIADHAKSYIAGVGSVTASELLSYNCILNFHYAGLEGNHSGNVITPVTSGKIAYISLTLTLVHLVVHAEGMVQPIPA